MLDVTLEKGIKLVLISVAELRWQDISGSKAGRGYLCLALPFTGNGT